MTSLGPAVMVRASSLLAQTPEIKDGGESYEAIRFLG